MATGYADRYPLRVGVALPDAIGGVHGAFAALAALWQQRMRGEAVHVDMSQLETALAFSGEALLQASLDGASPKPIGNRSRDHAPQGVYACTGEDRWLALTVDSDAAWRGTCEVLGLDPSLHGLDEIERRLRHDALDDLITAATSGRAADELAEALQARGVAACPAYTARDIVESEHLAERGFMVTLDHCDAGRRSFPGRAFHLRGEGPVLPAPLLGEHNDSVLHELDFAEADIALAVASGALADEPPE